LYKIFESKKPEIGYGHLNLSLAKFMRHPYYISNEFRPEHEWRPLKI